MGIQVTVKRIKSISFSPSFHSVHFVTASNTNGETDRAYTTQLPVPVRAMRSCMCAVFVCVMKRFGYVSCAFIPFNSSTSLHSIFSITLAYILQFLFYFIFVIAILFCNFSIQVKAIPVKIGRNKNRERKNEMKCSTRQEICHMLMDTMIQ